MDVRHADDKGALPVLDACFTISEDDQLTATRAYFLQVGFELFQQFVVRCYRDHRHVSVDQRQRAMLELTGRISLGVDVGNFL